MKIVEFRIFMPIKLERCRMASKYAVNKQTKVNTGGGDGFEIIDAKDVVENGRPGRYVYRILHCKNKIPSMIRWAVSDKFCHIHEHNHNSFPHYSADFSIPAMGDCFLMHTETDHYEYHHGKEIPDNLTNMSETDLKSREIYYLDILNGPASKKKDLDLHGFTCPEIGFNEELSATRGKSDDTKIPEWVHNYNGPLVLIVKTVKFQLKWKGIQSMTERIVGKTWYHVYLDSHRSMLKWGTEWYNLNDEEIHQIEKETKADLSKHSFDE